MEREENIRDNIIKLPKIELHCHLDGSLSREFVEKMLQNEPLPAPEFYVNQNVKDFYQFTVDDFHLENYQYHEFREKIPVAV